MADNTIGALFDATGSLRRVTDISQLSITTWPENLITLNPKDYSLPRGVHSQRLSLGIITTNGLPAGGHIVLSLDTSSELGGNDVEIGSAGTIHGPPCYIVSGIITIECDFIWLDSSSSVSINVDDEVPAGSITISLYGLYVLDTDETDLEAEESYSKWTVTTTNENGENLDDVDDLIYLTITYTSAAPKITVSGLMSHYDNAGS